MHPSLIDRTVPRSAIGTRAVVQTIDRSWRVVCATCESGGFTPYRDQAEAHRIAARRSTVACPVCGAS